MGECKNHRPGIFNPCPNCGFFSGLAAALVGREASACATAPSEGAPPAPERCAPNCKGIVLAGPMYSGCSCYEGKLANGDPQPPGFVCDCPKHPSPRAQETGAAPCPIPRCHAGMLRDPSGRDEVSCPVCDGTLTAEEGRSLAARSPSPAASPSDATMQGTQKCRCGRAQQTRDGWEAQWLFEDLPGGYVIHHNADRACEVVPPERPPELVKAWKVERERREAAEAALSRERLARERAERERDLAIAHDRQPYPTAEAYETVCAALHRKEAALEAAEQSAERMAGALRRWRASEEAFAAYAKAYPAEEWAPPDFYIEAEAAEEGMRAELAAHEAGRAKGGRP